MASPGALSEAHVAARVGGPGGDSGASRVTYVHPIRLYLTINLLFFFLAPWVNSSNVSVWNVNHAASLQMQPRLVELLDQAVARSGAESHSLFLAVFDERLSAQQGVLVWILIPGLGLASFLVARRRRVFLVEHFVFATNLISFLLVSMMAVGLAARLVLSVVDKDTKWVFLAVVVILAWLVWCPVTVYRSSVRFHRFSHPLKTLAFTLWMGAAFVAGFWIYMQALFVLTLIGLRDLVLG